MELNFVLIICSLICSAFFSAMELAYISANRLRIEVVKKNNTFQAKILNLFYRKESNMIALDEMIPRETFKVGDRARVAALCDGLAPRADLLIEHLHRLNDAEGALRKGHLAALAEHLRLSQVEVFEVASFYHHFQIVDDDAAVPRTTVRVCTSLSCSMAGASSLLHGLQAQLAGDASVQVIEAPCIGQCHRAPAACVGQHQLPLFAARKAVAREAGGALGRGGGGKMVISYHGLDALYGFLVLLRGGQ